MKKLSENILTTFAIMLLGIMSSCSAGGRSNVDKPVAPNLVNVEEGEAEEYELIIIDPGYQSWIATNAKPVSYYSPSYYRNLNQQYVAAWNSMVAQQANYDPQNYPFENRIQYESHIDYGVELDYELYWYFRYIQHLYGNLYNFPGFAVR